MTIGEPMSAVMALTGSTVDVPGTCAMMSQMSISMAPTKTVEGINTL